MPLPKCAEDAYRVASDELPDHIFAKLYADDYDVGEELQPLILLFGPDQDYIPVRFCFIRGTQSYIVPDKKFEAVLCHVDTDKQTLGWRAVYEVTVEWA